MRKQSKPFQGDFGLFNSKRMEKTLKEYGSNVMKPTAVRTYSKGGKTYSQFYHKPLVPGELD